MKAHYKSANGRLVFEVEGGTQKDLFENIASLQEVFEADSTCGCCRGTDIRFNVRKVDAFTYYEYRCTNPQCRAQLSFGQNKVGGGLFPKRMGDNGPLPNRGWSVYQPKD
jgi:hypothetical protein